MGLSTTGVWGGELDAPTAPTQILILTPLKWPGRMGGHELHGVFQSLPNSFCFQGTLLLDTGLGALCQGNAGGKCFLAPAWVPQQPLLTPRSCGQCTWEHTTAQSPERHSCLPWYSLTKGLVRAAQTCSEMFFLPVPHLSLHQLRATLSPGLQISSRNSARKAASQREGTSLSAVQEGSVFPGLAVQGACGVPPRAPQHVLGSLRLCAMAAPCLCACEARRRGLSIPFSLFSQLQAQYPCTTYPMQCPCRLHPFI